MEKDRIHHDPELYDDQFYEDILDDEEFYEQERERNRRGNARRRTSPAGTGQTRSQEEKNRRSRRSQERYTEQDPRRRQDSQRERDPRRGQDPRRERDPRRRQDPRREQDSRRGQDLRRERDSHRGQDPRRERDSHRGQDSRRERDPRRDQDPRRGYEDRPNRPDSGPKKKRKKKNRGCLGCLIPFLIILAIFVGGIYLVFSLILARMPDGNVRQSSVSVNADLPDSVKQATKNYHTIMLYGVDSRDQDPTRTGALADANILVTINKKTGEIRLTSIYRDTYVETTHGDYMKLTEVYGAYGAQESMQTINRNYDLNVNQYVTVTWAAVATAINSLGGLDLEITAKEAEQINKYIDEVIKNTGIDSEHVSEEISSNGETVHLDGVQSVTYCRLRKGLGDDYQRTQRQRTVIGAAFAKAKGNPIIAAKAAYDVMPMLASNLSTSDLTSLMLGSLHYQMGTNEGYPYECGADISYVYANTVRSNAEELHRSVYNNTAYEASDTVWRISRAVAEHSGYWGN